MSYLSLDVTLGATAVGWYFFHLTETQIPTAWFVVFPLSVYGIYNLDHWLDVRPLDSSNIMLHHENPRRDFHLKYLQFIKVTILISLTFAFVLGIVYFSYEMIITGFVIGLIASFHFLILNLKIFTNRFYPVKEMTIALIYSLGTSFPLVLPSHHAQINAVELAQFVFLFLIVWNNLLVNAICDYEEDKKEGFPSLPIQIGINSCLILFAVSTTIAFLCITMSMYFDPNMQKLELPQSWSHLRRYGIFCIALLLPIYVLYLELRSKHKTDLSRILGELPFILFFLA